MCGLQHPLKTKRKPVPGTHKYPGFPPNPVKNRKEPRGGVTVLALSRIGNVCLYESTSKNGHEHEHEYGHHGADRKNKKVMEVNNERMKQKKLATPVETAVLLIHGRSVLSNTPQTLSRLRRPHLQGHTHPQKRLGN